MKELQSINYIHCIWKVVGCRAEQETSNDGVTQSYLSVEIESKAQFSSHSDVTQPSKRHHSIKEISFSCLRISRRLLAHSVVVYIKTNVVLKEKETISIDIQSRQEEKKDGENISLSLKLKSQDIELWKYVSELMGF